MSHDTKINQRLKVLISAYACHPDKGSESAVGWGWSTTIAKCHDVWVLTSDNNRGGIEGTLDRNASLREHYHPVYVRPFQHLKAIEWIERHIWPPIDLFVYKKIWQRRAYQVALKLHQIVGFDLAHNLTYVGFRVPGYLWKLGIPFVWGPIGGLEQTNLKLLDGLGLKAHLHYWGRNWFNRCDKLLRFDVRRAMRSANGNLIAATSGIRDEIKRYYGFESTVICEVGLPPSGIREIADLSKRKLGEPLRLIWIGNLLPGKALPHFFRAVIQPVSIGDEGLRQRFKDENWTLDVVGDGPEKNAWRSMAKKLGLQDRIRWHGLVPRQQALVLLQAAHALLVTSVYDLTSTVVVEALANGIPVFVRIIVGFGMQ